MAQWILGILTSGGYAGLAMLAALECVFPPLPSELIFPMAGYLVAQGELNYLLSVAAGAAGNYAGSLPLYWIGQRLGSERIEEFVGRHCRWTSVSADEVRRAGEWFDRHGAWAVLVAHFVPGLRSLIAFPAGAARMPGWQFCALTLAGAAVWTAALIGGGFLLRENFEGIEGWLDPLTWVVLGVAVAVYVRRIVRQRAAA